MKYAIIDNTGRPTAFYDKTDKNVPKEAIEITDEDWLGFLSDQSMKRFKNGKLITRSKDLSEFKQEKINEIKIKTQQKLKENIIYKGKSIPIDQDFLYKAKNTLSKNPGKIIKKENLGLLNNETIVELLDLIEENSIDIYTREAELLEEIKLASNLKELNEIDIESGW